VLALEAEARVRDLDVEVLLTRQRFQTAPTASPISALPLSVPRSTRSAISDRARSVASRRSLRLRARAWATSGVRQTISRSPG
jgi:hypothetical protein